MGIIADASEKEWEARHDFETIVRARKISQDKKRWDKAMKAGEKLKTEKNKEMKAFNDVIKNPKRLG
jgi:hypothetical protein